MEVSISTEPVLAIRERLVAEIRKAAAEAPRMYFAPLIGAVRGIRSQYRAIGAAGRHKPQQEQASGQVRR